MADFQINDKPVVAVADTQHLLHQAGATPGGVTARWSVNDLLAWLKTTGDLITKGLADTLYAPIAHVGSGGTAHSNASGASAGFMSSADKTKLDGLDAGDYAPASHVGATGAAHGVVTGSVNGFMISTDKTKLDGLNAADYAPASHVGSGGAEHANATGVAAGFMSAADKTKLDGLGAAAVPPIHVALTDQTSEITTGLKLTIYAPYAMTLSEIMLGVATQDTAAAITVNASINGNAICASSLPTISANNDTNAGDGHVITNPTVAKNDKLDFVISATGTVGRGLTCALLG